MTEYALRGTLEGGGYVQQPLTVDHEPSIDEAKAMWPLMVERLPHAEWTVVANERQPEPKKAVAK